MQKDFDHFMLQKRNLHKLQNALFHKGHGFNILATDSGMFERFAAPQILVISSNSLA